VIQPRKQKRNIVALTGLFVFVLFSINCFAVQAGEMVPTNPDELFVYLQKGEYKSFVHESEMHRSKGPHDDVTTFMNPILDASMKAGNTDHPLNAASVKELYKNGTMYGWAVMVKIKMDGDSKGSRWYWYEVTSTTDAKEIYAEGVGASACAGCHLPGIDMVRSKYPLR
jgi:hypothetical protein